MLRAVPATADDLRADLLFLRDVFPRVDKSFTPPTAALFRERIDAAVARVGSLSEGAFAMAVAHAIAAAGNAHTMPLLHQWLRVAPIRLRWFADGLFVVRAAAGPAELVGARVTAIADRAPEEWLARLRDYVGGTDERCRVLSAFYLSSAEALAGIDSSAPPDRLQLAFVDRRGRPHTCAFEPVSLDANLDIFPRIDPHIGPLEASAASSWRQVADDPGAAPLYLRDAHRNVFHEWLPAHDALYVGLRRTTNTGELDVTRYLDRVIDEARLNRLHHAIVDLRFNDGGDFVLARKFCQALPAAIAVDGRLSILMNSETFSAGLVVAALLKYYGGARATVVGERASDRPVFWADGGVFELPHSELPVRCATALHDWERGCQDDQRCAWFNLLYSVPAGSLEPATMVPTTFDDYVNGRDPVLEAVLHPEARSSWG